MLSITLCEFLQFTGTVSTEQLLRCLAAPVRVHEDTLWGCSANTVP